MIRFNKGKFFPWKTRNTDGNGVNKQNTHAQQTLKKITEKGLVWK